MVNDKENEVICLRGGTVMTFDDEDRVFENGEIRICGGEITYVGPSSLDKSSDDDTVIDQTGRLIIPGLINAHTHSYSSLLKGTVERDPLDLYMLSIIATGSAMSPREIEVAASLDAVSMLLTGVTGVIDHYSERPALSGDGLKAVRRGFERVGIRATIATMFADKPYIDTIPINRETVPQEILDRYAAQPVPDAAEYFAIMEQAVAMNSADSPTRVILGVDGPQRCSDELIEMTGDFQRRHHCGLHTHMLETKTQAVMADRKGPGFVRRMLEAGIIDEKSSLVHFIWADDDDIAAAREGGVTVIHCPASNLMLGAGISPVLRLRDAGIPVAFGTDGSNCGPPSLFETMRMGCYLMRLTDPDFEKWPDAPEVLRSAYRSGSRAMGWNEKTGVLKNGARADVVSLDQGGHWHSPMGDLKRHLLHYENGSSVSDVWVDGMQVVKNKEITALDLDGLLSEAQDIVLRRRDMVSAKAIEAIESQYPAFRNMIMETLKDDFGIERRVRLN